MNNLKDFLNNVIEDEKEENNLNSQDEMIPSVDIAKKLEKGLELRRSGTLITDKSWCMIRPPVGGISKVI